MAASASLGSSFLVPLNPRLNHSLKPFFLSLFRPSSSSSSSLLLTRPRTVPVPFPKPLFAPSPKSFSSLTFAQSPTDNVAAPPLPSPAAEELQKIDVNPPKGTRDFPPEEMRLRNWLFHNFKEVFTISHSFCFLSTIASKFFNSFLNLENFLFPGFAVVWIRRSRFSGARVGSSVHQKSRWGD